MHVLGLLTNFHAFDRSARSGSAQETIGTTGSVLQLTEMIDFHIRSDRKGSDYEVLLEPHPTMWQQRIDKRNERVVSIRSEKCPPPEHVMRDEHCPQLRRINFWDHVEIKVFPLIIRFPHDHYPPFRRYFFPDTQDDVEADTRATFLQGIGLGATTAHDAPLASDKAHTKRTSTFSRSFSGAEHKSTAPPVAATESTLTKKAEQIRSHHFKYARVNEIELQLSYKGGMVDFTDKILLIRPFPVNRMTADLNKLCACICHTLIFFSFLFFFFFTFSSNFHPFSHA